MLTIETKNILNKYAYHGVIKGAELLLPKEFLISFIDDLAESGVQINGCDLWRFQDSKEDPNRIVALLGDGVLVQYANPLAKSADDYANTVKEYILHGLPSDADLVSLIFEDGAIYDFIINIGLRNGTKP